MNIAEQLRDARMAAGATQTEVAEAAKVDQAQISQWERNVHSPSLESAILWAEALGYSIVLKKQ